MKQIAVIAFILIHYVLGQLTYGATVLYNLFVLFHWMGAEIAIYPSLILEGLLLYGVFFRKNRWWTKTYAYLKFLIGLLILIIVTIGVVKNYGDEGLFQMVVLPVLFAMTSLALPFVIANWKKRTVKMEEGRTI